MLNTVYDWVTVGVFAGLIVLFLQRSSEEGPSRDSLWQYLVAATGCAVVNFLGNNGQPIFAVVLGIAVLAFIAIVLKPFDFKAK